MTKVIQNKEKRGQMTLIRELHQCLLRISHVHAEVDHSAFTQDSSGLPGRMIDDTMPCKSGARPCMRGSRTSGWPGAFR